MAYYDFKKKPALTTHADLLDFIKKGDEKGCVVPQHCI